MIRIQSSLRSAWSLYASKFRLFVTKVPEKSSWAFTETELHPKAAIELDDESLNRLERFSMLRIKGNRTALARLNSAILAAKELTNVDTAGVAPINSLMETMPMQLREDAVFEECRRGELLRNASVVEEGYLVTPPGNAPVSETEQSKKRTSKQPDAAREAAKKPK